MLWLAEKDFERSVPILWRKSGFGPGFPPQTGETRTLGIWRQVSGVHIITLYPDGATPDGNGGKIRCRIEEGRVTFDLTGPTRWLHTLMAGQTQASIMHVGGRVIPIVVHTEALRIHVTPTAGQIAASFTLIDGDEAMPIHLELAFGTFDQVRVCGDSEG